MITAYFFCFLYAISATSGSVIFFGVSVRAVHAMLFVLFFTGLWILVFFGYSSIFHVAIGMIANFLMAGVFMLGGIYKGVHLDVSDKKAGWIFVVMVSILLIILLVLIGIYREIFSEIPNFLFYLVLVVFICIFGSISVIRRGGESNVKDVT